jgi:hypothetical protein
MSSVWPEVLEACRKFAELGHGAAKGRHTRGGPETGPGKLPMFTRHEYRTRARDKWAARGVARGWSGELKLQAAG